MALNRQENVHFSMEKRMKIMNYVFFIHKIIISAVKTVQLVIGCHT
jgi:hypothetical protein